MVIVVNRQTKLTYEDYVHFPDDGRTHELIDITRKHIISPKKINAAPALVVEILSESTAPRDLSLKRDLYQRAGVPEYWIVDPEANEVRPHRLSADGVYEELPRQRERIEFHTERLHAVVDLTQVW
jgi:Uma2 family endonuclease